MREEEKEIFEKAEYERAIKYVNDWVSTIINTEQYKYDNFTIKTYVGIYFDGSVYSSSEIKFTDIPLLLRTEQKPVNWKLIPKRSFWDFEF